MNAQSVGRNFTIYQGVTIGASNGGIPIIKDNVTIFAGAKVFGDILINNNVIIGANSVVTHDCEENGIYVGNPAKLLKYNEKNKADERKKI